MSEPNPASPEPSPTPATGRHIQHGCRNLTTRGVMCRQAALTGQDFCVAHRERCLSLPTPGHITVPLLEDHGSIQLMLSKILHSVLNNQLAGALASKAAYCCQVAANTLPRPVAPRLKAGETPAEPQAVTEVFTDEAGNLIGPLEDYHDPAAAAFEPQWSWSKYLYEKECEELGIPTPTSAADFPASGWLSEEERQYDPARLVRGYTAHIRAIRERDFFIRKEESAAALADGLPDPHAALKRNNPRCASGTLRCGGPLAFSACPDCRLKRRPAPSPSGEPSAADAPSPASELAELNAAADSEQCSDHCSLSTDPCQRCSEPGAQFPVPSPQVVELVNQPAPLIPNDKKLVPQGGTPHPQNKNTQKTRPTRSEPLPLLTLDQRSARYYASAAEPAPSEVASSDRAERASAKSNAHLYPVTCPLQPVPCTLYPAPCTLSPAISSPPQQTPSTVPPSCRAESAPPRNTPGERRETASRGSLRRTGALRAQPSSSSRQGRSK